ncbi:glycine-rich cell wall structural protein 1.8-like [Phoenix dactylifera]|uniref:Glycine-rich cell wall structural protein 1.8-like n=1 Tax=Phoenix dactylifera TaxID=42345 RepID=A0A8B8ZHD5_PHODC|nr:glycine-rich cell wall structural protein 1.8-like [Phoenix dactylifera]
MSATTLPPCSPMRTNRVKPETLLACKWCWATILVLPSHCPRPNKNAFLHHPFPYKTLCVAPSFPPHAWLQASLITSNMLHSMATSRVLSLQAFALLWVVPLCSASRGLLAAEVKDYGAGHGIAGSLGGQGVGYGGSAHGGMYGGGPYGAGGEQETNYYGGEASGGNTGGSNGYDGWGPWGEHGIGFNGGSPGGDDGFGGYGAHWAPGGDAGGEHYSGGEHGGSYNGGRGGSAGGSGSYDAGGASGGGSWTGYWFSSGSNGGGGAGGSVSYGAGDEHNGGSGGSASHGGANGYGNLGGGGGDHEGHPP